MYVNVDLTLCTRTHSSGSLYDTDSHYTQTLEVRNVTAQAWCTLLKSEQFLARISDRKVSSLSEHNCDTNHVRLKGPNNDDPVIRFDIYYDSDIKAGIIGFQ